MGKWSRFITVTLWVVTSTVVSVSNRDPRHWSRFIFSPQVRDSISRSQHGSRFLTGTQIGMWSRSKTVTQVEI